MDDPYDVCDGLRGESEIFGASDPFRAWFDSHRELDGGGGEEVGG